jgi:hypothetical protein
MHVATSCEENGGLQEILEGSPDLNRRGKMKAPRKSGEAGRGRRFNPQIMVLETVVPTVAAVDALIAASLYMKYGNMHCRRHIVKSKIISK